MYNILSGRFRVDRKRPFSTFLHGLCISLVTILNVSKDYRTLYLGLVHTAPPTNTNFRLTFLLTPFQEALYEDIPV